MKKTTDFSYYLSNFLTKYLPVSRGLRKNTINSYKDTFILLLKFSKEVHGIKPDHLDFPAIDKTMITSFLDWLEEKRKVSARTRNQRLAAIHSFFRYIQETEPALLHKCQNVLILPFKKVINKSIAYLTLDEIKAILEVPNKSTPDGRRDLVMLSLLYDTGARVQEIIDLKVHDIRTEHPATVRLTGKGNKTRIVPIMNPTAKLAEIYLEENSMITSDKQTYPLFTNRMNEVFTRAGVSYILSKYVKSAKRKKIFLQEKVTPHLLRHSKAMHLLQAGVNLIYIRDILGHVDLKTTEIYARIDGKMKREALEKAFDPELTPRLPTWQKDKNLLVWLQSFNK